MTGTELPSKEKSRASPGARELLETAERAVVSNRIQKIAFVAATLAITAAGVTAAVIFSRPKILIFAVASDGAPETKFARKLSDIVALDSRQIRVNVVTVDGQAGPLTKMAQGKADLAIARTDMKPPNAARAIAVVEHNLMLALAPKDANIKSLSAVENRRLVVIGGDARDSALVRDMTGAFDLAGSKAIEEAPVEVLPKLLDPAANAVVFAVVSKSVLAEGGEWPALARKPGFDMVEIDGNKALERRLRGVSAETIDAGLVSASPRLPADDLNSIGIDDLLVARNTVSNSNASELARIILENKDLLSVDSQYATNIEPPDIDKDAHIVAHPGAVDYMNGNVKTFVDRYSDLIYVCISLLSIVGSIFVALYAEVTRVSPIRAGTLTDALFDIADKIRAAPDLAAIGSEEAEIEMILKGIVAGMRDGAITTDGFEIFRLAYDAARDAAAHRRQTLAAVPAATWSTASPSADGAGPMSQVRLSPAAGA